MAFMLDRSVGLGALDPMAVAETGATSFVVAGGDFGLVTVIRAKR